MTHCAKQRILAAAIHLFAHKGYGQTSVREVVERAGVTKPTLYYWFENKEGLYLECVRTTFAEMTTLVQDAVTGSGTVEERLVRFVHDYVQKGLEDLDRVRLALTATNPSHEKRPQIDLMTFHTEHVLPLGQLFAEGIASGLFRPHIHPEMALLALLGPCSMLLRGAVEGMPLEPDYAERVVDVYLHGVALR
jgi:TetR/AcrR family transcriptional regulator